MDAYTMGEIKVLQPFKVISGTTSTENLYSQSTVTLLKY